MTMTKRRKYPEDDNLKMDGRSHKINGGLPLMNRSDIMVHSEYKTSKKEEMINPVVTVKSNKQVNREIQQMLKEMSDEYQ